jgi:hypothetical protein
MRNRNIYMVGIVIVDEADSFKTLSKLLLLGCCDEQYSRLERTPSPQRWKGAEIGGSFAAVLTIRTDVCYCRGKWR